MPPRAYTLWSPSFTRLPRREPGASLVAAPVPLFETPHTTDPRPYLRWGVLFKLWARFTAWFQLWLFGDDREFTTWWESTETARRKRSYRGRHCDDGRPRWVEYDTAWWPTLATEVSGCEIIDESPLYHTHDIPGTGGRVSCMSLHRCVTEPATFSIMIRPGYVRKTLVTI